MDYGLAQLLRNAAELVDQHKDQLDSFREDNVRTNAMNSQLQAELDAVKLSLGEWQQIAADRQAVIAELTAQLKTLGRSFIHGAREVQDILRVLVDKKHIEPDTPKDTGVQSPVERPPMDHFANIREKDTESHNIPFAKGTETKPLTPDQAPAFLLVHRTRDQLMAKMSWKERKQFNRDGIIPDRLRAYAKPIPIEETEWPRRLGME